MNNLSEYSKAEIQAKLNQRIIEASHDPVEFIDRFLWTFNPKEPPYHFPFELFDFQKDLVKDIQDAIEQGYDIFIEKSREMGASYTVLDVILWFWRYIPGSNFLLGSRKEQYVDNRGAAGSKEGEESNKEESLFGKLDYTLGRLPPFMLPKGFDMKTHFTTMSLVNPENGNVISGESSNANFSRGGRQKAILMDEFAFWDNDNSAWSSTADTTDCRIVITTPGIRPSKAKRLRYGVDGERIKVITLHYSLDPRKDQKWIDYQRSRRSPEDFAREIEIDWDKSIGGVIFKEFDMTKHVREFELEYGQAGDRYFGLDFAVRGWTASLVGYMGTDGVLYIPDEYKEEGKVAVEHAENIKTMLKKYAPLSAYVGFADPAGFADNQQSAVYSPTKNNEMIWSLADEYLEEGLPIVRANNEVSAGINFVRQKFGEGKIVIHPRCKDLIAEIQEYRWKDQTLSRKEEEDEPEKVRKINDHLVDAMRYLLYSKPVPPEEQKKEEQKIQFPIKFELKIDEPEEKFEEMNIPTVFD